MIATATQAEELVRGLRREAGLDLTASGICECFDCDEAETNEYGDVWIANPIPGRWLSESDLVAYANWELSR